MNLQTESLANWQFLLMIAKALGMDTSQLKSVGYAAAKKLVNTGAKAYWSKKAPGIVKRLTADGEKVGSEMVVGHDGIERTQTANAVRNAQYLFWKSLVRASFLADGIRDAHDDKIMDAVSAKSPTDLTQLVSYTYQEDADLTW